MRAVRNRISDLICRIAEDFPHLIIFPAVVGGASSSLTETDKLYKHLTSVQNDAADDDNSQGSDSICARACPKSFLNLHSVYLISLQTLVGSWVWVYIDFRSSLSLLLL